MIRGALIAITLLVNTPCFALTAGKYDSENNHFVMMMSHPPRDQWDSDYDGVQATAQLGFGHIFGKDLDEMFDEDARGYIRVDCGTDGFKLAVVVPRTMSGLKDGTNLQALIGRDHYTFFYSDGSFLADDSLVSQQQRDSLLRAIYDGDQFDFIISDVPTHYTLSWSLSPTERKHAIGLVRSACR